MPRRRLMQESRENLLQSLALPSPARIEETSTSSDCSRIPLQNALSLSNRSRNPALQRCAVHKRKKAFAQEKTATRASRLTNALCNRSWACAFIFEARGRIELSKSTSAIVAASADIARFSIDAPHLLP